jgi:hypothetical protein
MSRVGRLYERNYYRILVETDPTYGHALMSSKICYNESTDQLMDRWAIMGVAM